MTREEQLVFCKKCTNRDFNMTQGILCKLTGEKADFEVSCPDYELDKNRVVEVGPIGTVQPNGKRAAIAVQMLWAVMIVGVFSMISNYIQYGLLEDMINAEYVSDEAIEKNDMRVRLMSILYLVVFIGTATTFIMWFRRAYNNLAVRTRTQHTEGWAAGAWFVPIISLFRPYKIMSELFVKSHEMIRKKTGVDEKNEGNGLIGIWWALWILAGYIANYSLKMLFKEDTLENLRDGTMADIFVDFLDIPMGILAIMLIKAYNKKELKLLELENKAKEDIEPVALH